MPTSHHKKTKKSKNQWLGEVKKGLWVVTTRVGLDKTLEKDLGYLAWWRGWM